MVKVKKTKELSETELNDAISKTARYLLVMFTTTKDIVKSTNIIKHCFQGHPKNFDFIMNAAKDHLSEILDLKIVEVISKEKSKRVKKYFAVYNNTFYRDFTLTDEQKDYSLLLTLTLAHISLEGGQCSDESLWKLFTPLNLLSTTKHPRFGDVKKRVLTDFTNHLYVEIVPVGSKKNLKWGPRAFEEFDPEELNALFDKVYNDNMHPGTEDISDLFVSEEEKALRIVQ